MVKRAFTLIELLIVVAIIAILAAIAVPNFLEAQTRSKVSRVKSDMRALATALEAYCLDHNDYPDTINGGDTYVQFMSPSGCLTTPIAYIASADVRDPFTPEHSNYTRGLDWKATFWYASYQGVWAGIQSLWPGRRGWVMASYGPDRYQDNLAWYPFWKNHPDHSASRFAHPPRNYPHYIDMLYDPTKGTRSWGDVGRAGGNLNCEEQLGGG